jgi:hypothetical protein
MQNIMQLLPHVQSAIVSDDDEYERFRASTCQKHVSMNLKC